jgi:signal peptidase I
MKVRVVGFWTLGGMLLVAGGLLLFAFDFPRVHSNDMAPGLRDGDLLLACRVCGTPQRGDVVMFAPTDADSEEKLSFRRVLAVPGDKVEVKKGEILVNDRPIFSEKEAPLQLPIGQVTEQPVKFEAVTETTGKHRYLAIRDAEVSSVADIPATTLTNGFFLVADRRTFTRDSRHYGPVLKTRIRSIVKRVLAAGDKDAARQTWLP